MNGGSGVTHCASLFGKPTGSDDGREYGCGIGGSDGGNDRGFRFSRRGDGNSAVEGTEKVVFDAVSDCGLRSNPGDSFSDSGVGGPGGGGTDPVGGELSDGEVEARFPAVGR